MEVFGFYGEAGLVRNGICAGVVEEEGDFLGVFGEEGVNLLGEGVDGFLGGCVALEDVDF